MISDQQIEQAVHSAYGHYRPEALKRGRNPTFPYVPIYRFGEDAGKAQTTQIRGYAFATREEAVAYAQRMIDAFGNKMRADLRNPKCRALREQHGLPREI